MTSTTSGSVITADRGLSGAQKQDLCKLLGALGTLGWAGGNLDYAIRIAANSDDPEWKPDGDPIGDICGTMELILHLFHKLGLDIADRNVEIDGKLVSLKDVPGRLTGLKDQVNAAANGISTTGVYGAGVAVAATDSDIVDQIVHIIVDVVTPFVEAAVTAVVDWLASLF